MTPGLLATLGSLAASAQQPSAAELLRDIEHLQVVGSVLYVAAHPDDENTRLLAWLRGQRGLQATYLSMTRGGGGQNLIGTEQSELLGVVRTGELLAARAIDGAAQRFTRTRDFGYSKSADESLAFWGHDPALDDVVRAIRELRPDVIITRFDPEGRSHGHHTASAILAGEAFVAAADLARFPEQGLAAWQADRLLYNRSSWRITDETDTSGWLQVDVGTYDPLTGTSAGEVSAWSRTMHKSQGFGSSPQVGPLVEYFTVTDGTALAPTDDPLARLDLTWARFEGTQALRKAMKKAAERFDARDPAAALPQLSRIHTLLQEVPDPHWRAIKTAELERIMVACAGLHLTARATQPAVSPGGALPVALTALVRGRASVVLDEVRVDHHAPIRGAPLADAPWAHELTLAVAPDAALTVPHWLAEAPTVNSYTISEGALRTLPDTPPGLSAVFVVDIAGHRLEVPVPVTFAWTDRVDGERMHPVEVLPPATATFSQKGIMLPAGTDVRTSVTLRAPAGPAAGTLRLTPPSGVEVAPAQVPFDLTEASPEQVVAVTLRAEDGAGPGQLAAVVEVSGRAWAHQQAVIDHRHLPRRTILQPARLDLAPVALDRGEVTTVGYVAGSGDQVAESLRAVGYRVEELDEDAILARELDRFDTVVMGIRAYNTRPRLLALRQPLMDWVAAGGTLVVQYNTNNRWDSFATSLGPYPFEIGRSRVTDETATMTAVDPAHPALTTPNALGDDDFAGWVQERGLYFAEKWDDRYQPLFSAHDAGEEPLLGSTLVARHGEGTFVYTGLSFFRQLPAGVPGAYRLLANLLAL